MKICKLALGLGRSEGGAIIGGNVNYIVNVSTELTKRRHEVHIVTTLPVYPSSRRLELRDLFVYYLTEYPVDVRELTIKPNAALAFLLKAISKATNLNRPKRFDVIHAYSGDPGFSLVSTIAGAINSLPKVHTLTVPVSPEARTFSKICFSHSDRVIAVSENVRQSLRDVVPERKITVIPPCIDSLSYNPKVCGDAVRTALGLNGEATLVYVGNEKTKGIAALIEALKIVREEIADVRLIMVLDLPKCLVRSSALWRGIVNANLEDAVIPLGLVNNMPGVIGAADVMVVPFLTLKGVLDYPLPLLEAMACGKPVISTNLGGVREIVEHKKSGMLVEPDDPSSLADAILYVLGDKEGAREMGDQGAKYVHDNFTQGIVASRLEKAYYDLIA